MQSKQSFQPISHSISPSENGDISLLINLASYVELGVFGFAVGWVGLRSNFFWGTYKAITIVVDF